MKGILLVSKKTYSIAKKKPVTIWKSRALALDSISTPKNFELRSVNADLDGKGWENEFINELSLKWSDNVDIRDAAEELAGSIFPTTDILWYVDSLHTAFVIDSHSHHKSIVYARNIDALKKEFA